MKKRYLNSRWIIGLLFFLIVLFRLWHGASHVVFSQDQARDALLMQTYKNGGEVFVPYGPKASVGNFYLAPMYYQIMYWLYLVTGYELSMHYFIVVIEAFTPLLLFLSLRQISSNAASLAGAITYAFGYQVISFGTNMWNPNLIPFISALTLYASLSLVSKDRSSWWITAALAATTLGIHFHYQAVVLVPFLLATMFFYLRNKRSLLPIIVGIFLSLITFLPYIMTEAAYNWPNTSAIINFATKDHPRIYDRVSKPGFVLTFIPEFIERTLLGHTTRFVWLGRLLWVAGLLLLFIKFRSKLNLRLILMGIYMVTILLMLRVYKGDKLDFYMGSLYMLPAILICMITDSKKWAGVLLSVPIVFLSGLNIGKTPSFNSYQNMSKFCKQLAQEQTNFFPVIHDKDLTQLAWYCARTEGLKYDAASTFIADFYHPLRNVETESGAIFCNVETNCILRLARQVSGYSFIKEIANDNVAVGLGKVHEPLSSRVFTKSLAVKYELPNNPIPDWMSQKFPNQDYLF